MTIVAPMRSGLESTLMRSFLLVTCLCTSPIVAMASKVGLVFFDRNFSVVEGDVDKRAHKHLFFLSRRIYMCWRIVKASVRSVNKGVTLMPFCDVLLSIRAGCFWLFWSLRRSGIGSHCVRKFTFSLGDHLEGLFLIGNEKTAFFTVKGSICQHIDTAYRFIRDCHVLMLKIVYASVIDNLGLLESQQSLCRQSHALGLRPDDRLVIYWAHLLRGKIIEVFSQTTIVIEWVTRMLWGVHRLDRRWFLVLEIGALRRVSKRLLLIWAVTFMRNLMKVIFVGEWVLTTGHFVSLYLELHLNVWGRNWQAFKFIPLWLVYGKTSEDFFVILRLRLLVFVIVLVPAPFQNFSAFFS